MMKKLLLLICVLTLSLVASAQQGEKSALLKIGGQTEADRFGLGLEGRYMLTDNIRLAPDVTFYFPKNKVTGLDINLNAHYVFAVADQVTVYPLAGVAVLNNRVGSQKYETLPGAPDIKTKSHGATDFGFNLGAGASYHIDDKSFLNADMKYTFSDGDFFSLFVGYGIKF